MSKERNIRVYRAAYDYLMGIKPEGINLEDYFYGDSRSYSLIKDVYIQFISSAQNYQSMPNVIKYSQRESEVSKILFGYDIQRISEMSPEELYREFRERFSVRIH